MDRTGKDINADYAHRAGYIGNGVGVAVMDTGIVKHPDFDHRILVFRDFCIRKNIRMMIMGMVHIFRELLAEVVLPAVEDIWG